MHPVRFLTPRLMIAGSLVAVLALSCHHQPNLPEEEALTNNYREQLISVNEKLLKEEDELINAFIRRYGWDMIKTGTGLRFMIYAKGEGPAARDGNRATVRYSVVLLNGDTCYPSILKSFLLGKDKVEAGLDEGIRMMHVGDEAKFILPSHLAFGLMGDHQSIPQKATLVYDVHLLELKDN